jgi:mannitol/fructose-specific phosphotransferase system IIA component (Ntr-type)
MLLGEILHRSVIQPRLAARDRWSAIDELIDLLVRADDLTPAQREPVREVVRARELAGGTAMGDGVALPHGTTDRVENVVGALGLAPDGIDFEAHDGQPARLIILLVVPRNEFQTYVRNLAGIAHLLEEPGFRESLMAATDADTILKLVRREEHGSGFQSFLQRFGWKV